MTDSADDRTIVDHGVGEPDHLQRLWTPHRMSYIAETPVFKGGSAEAPEAYGANIRAIRAAAEAALA